MGRFSYIHVIDQDICNARIFEILPQTTDCNTVAAATKDVVDFNVVGARLDRYTIITALIGKVGELDVTNIHHICAPPAPPLINPATSPYISSSPNPSVFCIQFVPNGAFTAVGYTCCHERSCPCRS